MNDTASLLLSKAHFEDAKHLPEWLIREYQTFDKIVTRNDFPCTFGMAGQRKGELRYSFISHDDWSALPDALRVFNCLFDNQEQLIRHGLFVFVEPEKEVRSLEYYREYFWNVLQYLHESDEQTWPAEYPKDPEHHLWTFCFDKEPYFAFGSAPCYKQRKTRDLGNSLIIGFQPRRIFAGLDGTTDKGNRSREAVRKRVEEWDRLPTHPNISHYGDKNHREWKQYFIGDDMEPVQGACPFNPR